MSKGFFQRTATLLTFTFLLLIAGAAKAQEKRQIEIVQAGSLEGVKQDGKELRRLVGDVIFRQGETMMYCDSALFYAETNSIDAYGTIKILGPRAKIYGDVLHYNGNTELANLSGKEVKLTDDKMVLTTTALDYDLKNDVGKYSTGGKVVDTDNVLTSKRGFYYTNERAVYFKDNVVLNNPKYNIYADTLKYVTSTATAYFLGPSTIKSAGTDSSYIYCEYGWYNTQTGKSYFSEHAFIQSGQNRLSGDSLLYDRKTGLGRAWRNVAVTDTVEKVIISGDYAWLNEQQGKSFVTGTSMLTKIFTNDSLFLHADTLFASEDTATKVKTYFAYRHVRIFKTDLQGQCDSLVYSAADSTMHFYGLPVLWNAGNQLTATHIRLQLADNKLYRMYLDDNSFIASFEDSLRFNQVKGKNMTGHFTDNQLSAIDVNGNGQTVYYLRNGKKQLSGVNRADCSDMTIRIADGKVLQITLKRDPDATLFPIKEAVPGEMKLKDFKWWGDIQPKSTADIFLWPGADVAE